MKTSEAGVMVKRKRDWSTKPKTKVKKTIQVCLDQSDIDYVVKEAKVRNMYVSALVRQIIEEAIRTDRYAKGARP